MIRINIAPIGLSARIIPHSSVWRFAAIIGIQIFSFPFGVPAVPFELALVLVMSVLAALASIPRWRDRLARARSRVNRNRAGAGKASAHIRDLARANLRAKREIRRLEVEIVRARANAEIVIRNIAILEQIDDRVCMVDDKRLSADTQWVGVVTHGNYEGVINRKAPPALHNAWLAGRKCAVWAKTAELARSNLTALLPPEKGYKVGEIAPLPGHPKKRET